jgi:DNA invertase Pin-like site-specific DNA recombinase
MKQLRCALYARVSTDGKGQDLLNQIIPMREFATQQGWIVVLEFADELSAKNGNRPGFQAMWKAAAGHRFDVLLFWSLDRLTREGTLATLTYLRRLKDAGVAFKSYKEEYVDSLGVFADAIVGILAAVAEQERIRLSDRTKAGLQRLKASGKTWKRGVNKKYKGGEPSRTTLWRRSRKAANQ